MFGRRRLSLDAWRRKVIRETESALLAGLLYPERAPRIPRVEVGTAIFDAGWARRWWNNVLELDCESRVA